MANKKKEKDNQNWSAKDKTAQEIQFLYGKRKDILLQKHSEAESHFESLLKQQPYFYLREKAFYKDNFLCYVDFYIPRFKLAIEIDGIEHNTSKAKYRDKLKQEFLQQERGVKTYRISNKECLSLKKVNIDDIMSHFWTSFGKDQWLRTEDIVRKRWLSEMENRVDFDISKPIFLYSIKNDVIYKFKDCYEMSQSIEMKNKDIFRNLLNQDNFKNNSNFIFANCLEVLEDRIIEFHKRW